MNAQIILTIYLFLLLCTGIYKIARNSPKPCTKSGEIVGSTIGHIVKYVSIFVLLWWGGFYSNILV